MKFSERLLYIHNYLLSTALQSRHCLDAYCWKKLWVCLIFPKLSFSRSWCLDSHELISTNIASGRLRKAALLTKVHSSFSARPPWFKSAPLLLSKGVFVQLMPALSRGGHGQAQPISLFHPFGPDWLMGGHVTQARPGRLNFRVWLECLERKLPVLCGCGTWGWKP